MSAQRARSTVRIYTDGACSPNPGPGGWGAVILRAGAGPEDHAGHADHTTNNRMELTAAIEALRRIADGETADLFTDSTYVRNGITRWIEGWKRTGWFTAGGDPVKNADLWRALDDELGRVEIRWHWVKGHAGNRWNERADRLARGAGRPPVAAPAGGLPPSAAAEIAIYTAASFAGRTGRGGWGVVLQKGEHTRELSGGQDGGSANAMHLRSAIEGLRALRRRVHVEVHTTSDYLASGATQWIAGWRARGWVSKERKPVANRELWEQLDELQRAHEVRWTVTRDDGAGGVARAKALATAAATASSGSGRAG